MPLQTGKRAVSSICQGLSAQIAIRRSIVPGMKGLLLVLELPLVEAGVTILRAPSEGRFGRQFTFLDPDDYAITIYDHDAPPEGWNHTGS